MTARALAAAIAAILLAGCTALQQPGEIAWQAGNVVDALQTATLRDDPCLHEGSALTAALIGTDPSRESVAAWAIGGAAIHAGVTEWLLSTDRPRLARAWQYVTLTEKGIAVYRNAEKGVRLLGENAQRCMR